MLESYIIARDRFLVPKGKMFPSIGRSALNLLEHERTWIYCCNGDGNFSPSIHMNGHFGVFFLGGPFSKLFVFLHQDTHGTFQWWVFVQWNRQQGIAQLSNIFCLQNCDFLASSCNWASEYELLGTQLFLDKDWYCSWRGKLWSLWVQLVLVRLFQWCQ